MIPVQDYKILSGEAYQIDVLKGGVPWQQGDILENKNLSQSYEVLKVEDNITNGMQAMAVAPIKKDKVDSSEIIIAYAGTNPGDNLDLRTDIQTVIGGSKLLDTSKFGKLPDSPIDGQVITAENFAKDIKNDYPDSVITTTGHSLREFIALYVAAENGWKNVGFNGPDPYKILSDETKVWVEKNPGMLFNYRNKEDLIGNFGGNKTGAAIVVDMSMGRNIKDLLKFHNLSSWEFDEEGQLVISDTVENKEARLVQVEKLMYARMNELALLAKKLTASGGGLSANEEIYLNNTEALIILESVSQSMKIGLEYIVKIYRDAILEAEEVWADGIERAKKIGTELSYYEIIEALAAGGATKYAIVDKPTAFYEGKIADVKQIEVSFNRLARDIKISINKLIETDKDLARQISQGV